MALLSFRIVLLLCVKLLIISETVCFTQFILPNNIFSNSLSYVTLRLKSVQPQFNLNTLPETHKQNYYYARPTAGLNNVLQNLPKATTTTKTNIEILKSNLSTERSINNTTTQNPNIENKEIDEKWNTFFDNYFENQASKTEKSLTTKIKKNGKTPVLEDILDDKYIETTSDSVTDTTDTTLSDNETTTDDDDLLRNGVPPELLSSLLG